MICILTMLIEIMYRKRQLRPHTDCLHRNSTQSVSIETAYCPPALTMHSDRFFETVHRSSLLKIYIGYVGYIDRASWSSHMLKKCVNGIHWNRILTAFTESEYWLCSLKQNAGRIYWNRILAVFTETAYCSSPLKLRTGCIYWENMLAVSNET